MEGYGYTYPAPFPQMGYPAGEFPDHGDGFGEYYGLEPINGDHDVKRYFILCSFYHLHSYVAEMNT